MDFDKFKGAFVGLACGDALGAPVEFIKRGRFQPVTDFQSGGKFRVNPGQWTDDTSMALCLADSLLAKGCFDAADQMDRYADWINTGYNSSKPHAFGIGKTILNAMMSYSCTNNPYSGATDPKTAGNGSLMRLVPIALAYHRSIDDAIHYAGLSSKTTHGAEESVLCCQYLAFLIVRCVNGENDKEKLFDDALKLDFIREISPISNQTFKTKDREKIVGSGYVVQSLEAALWCFWHSKSYSEAVLLAVNLGDDADTTAAICGQLAGAFYGFESIPLRWREQLYMSNEIQDIAIKSSMVFNK